MERPVDDVIWKRWGDVDRVYGQALALQGRERAAFLAETCRDDPALLDAVSTLTRASDCAREALPRPRRPLLLAALRYALARRAPDP